MISNHSSRKKVQSTRFHLVFAGEIATLNTFCGCSILSTDKLLTAITAPWNRGVAVATVTHFAFYSQTRLANLPQPARKDRVNQQCGSALVTDLVRSYTIICDECLRVSGRIFLFHCSFDIFT